MAYINFFLSKFECDDSLCKVVKVHLGLFVINNLERWVEFLSVTD